MAKEVIWSELAIADRKNILSYWILRNKSKAYSIKLDALFREAALMIAEYPFIGKQTDIKNVWAKKVRDYFILYQEKEDQIHILTIWDTRQKPSRLKRRVKKGHK
jgi:plasmid stabilization system protein ParE